MIVFILPYSSYLAHCAQNFFEILYPLLKTVLSFGPWFLQSVGSDFEPWPCPHMTLAVGGTLNTNKNSVDPDQLASSEAS